METLASWRAGIGRYVDQPDYGRDMRELGPVLIVVGLVIAVVGGLAWSGAFGWFGRLPGDIRITGEHTRVYVPITSMIILSVILSVLLTLLRR